MNIEKYNKLHNELMNRLEAGEITTERAKEINDLAFDKYITEGHNSVEDNMKKVYNELIKAITPIINKSNLKKYMKIYPFKKQQAVDFRGDEIPNKYATYLMSYNIDGDINPLPDDEWNKLWAEWVNDLTVDDCYKKMVEIIKKKYADMYKIGECVGRTDGFYTLEMK